MVRYSNPDPAAPVLALVPVVVVTVVVKAAVTMLSDSRRAKRNGEDQWVGSNPGRWSMWMAAE